MRLRVCRHYRLSGAPVAVLKYTPNSAARLATRNDRPHGPASAQHAERHAEASVTSEIREDDFRRRNDILDKLQRGQIKLEEAEKAAADANLPPLASRPPPGQFDPDKRAHWSLPMTLAWIASRDVELVRTFDDEYRQECWDFEFKALRLPRADGNQDNYESRDGWHLVQRSPASWTNTLIFLRCDQLDAPKAESELLENLERGTLHAEAVRVDDRALITIPASEWSRLEFCDDDRWRIYLRYKHEPFSRIYSHVLLPRVTVMKLWKIGPSGGSKHRAAKYCKEWMEQMMAASPDNPTMTKADCLKEAMNRFGVKKSRAESIYQECNRAPDRAAWRATGPKKNRPERQNVTRKGRK